MARKTREILKRLNDQEQAAWRELQRLPNVGPAIAYDLLRLGIRRPMDLSGRDHISLYEELCTLDAVRHDPCVLDTMMAVVDHAETGRVQPWWHFTPERKAKKWSG